ncbi:MAG: hypothetical protein FWE13_01815 [Firmicutes bacterium]|nr:hypothetical protein [Bacillota bacterium]
MQCILYETEKIHKETLAKCVANGYLVISDKGVDITSKGIGEFETYISKQMKESNAKLVATIKIVTTVVIMATGIVAVIIQILGLI